MWARYLWLLELFAMYATDGQTDGQKQRLLPRSLRSGHNNYVEVNSYVNIFNYNSPHGMQSSLFWDRQKAPNTSLRGWKTSTNRHASARRRQISKSTYWHRSTQPRIRNWKRPIWNQLRRFTAVCRALIDVRGRNFRLSETRLFICIFHVNEVN